MYISIQHLTVGLDLLLSKSRVHVTSLSALGYSSPACYTALPPETVHMPPLHCVSDSQLPFAAYCDARAVGAATHSAKCECVWGA